ncbi:tRNA (guanine(10)-N(2))-methyltransferase TRMT11-like isoform X2 [Tubulanus polymorphus]|uniref:tRNA (guanine(10)-N(2))-methyltransferase TRMT11-like isoform X2 n=1 Tax=Tubulanus polymorphus TaxID=672921 RepID=UPI003DA51DF9
MAAPVDNMAAPIEHAFRRYLIQFANEHVDFRVAEIKSIATLINTKLKIVTERPQNDNPFVVVTLPSEECARKLAGRAVLVRSIYELWSSGNTHSDVFKQLKSLPDEFKTPYLKADVSYKVKVDVYNRSLHIDEKLARIEKVVDSLGSKGNIQLSNPDEKFCLLEYFGLRGSTPPADPLHVYIGRWIADGNRTLPNHFNLKKRHFIGNTSMDPGLSLIMGNMASVQKNDVVMDPFVGTGSLLVAAAHYGAYVMGTDIDYLLLHGKGRPSRHDQKVRGPDENVRANLRQYGMESQYIDVMISDASKYHVYRDSLKFDAIVADPPYGIREPAMKLGSKTGNIKTLTDEDKINHVPSKKKYLMSDIFKDLLNFAAKHLKLGGRLVYWLPIHRPEYVESNIPRHAGLNLVANCEQPITSHISRRLITMEKIHEFNSAQVELDHFQDNNFREKYFRMDAPPETSAKHRKLMNKKNNLEKLRLRTQQQQQQQQQKDNENTTEESESVRVAESASAKT